MLEQSLIIRTVLAHYPDVQGIYLFGSYGTSDESSDSDIDIALLLPPLKAKNEGYLALSPCRQALAESLRKEVDLVIARQLSTVLQKEIVANGRLIHCTDRYAVDEFEMLVLSYYYYQKLNDERREIVDAFIETGRAYAV